MSVVTILHHCRRKAHLGTGTHACGLDSFDGLIHQDTAVVWIGREALPVTSTFSHTSNWANHRAQHEIDAFPAVLMAHMDCTFLGEILVPATDVNT